MRISVLRDMSGGGVSLNLNVTDMRVAINQINLFNLSCVVVICRSCCTRVPISLRPSLHPTLTGGGGGGVSANSPCC